MLCLAHLHGRGGETVEDGDAIFAEASEAEDAGGALLHAGGAAEAFGVFHGHAFVGEVHHVDALMTNAGADVAGDALFLFGKNPIAREARVDVHERGDGATFIGRNHATQVNHMIQMIERAMDHDGFSVIECLSECVEFYPGVFDAGNPRKGGEFKVIDEKKWDNTPEDEARHDVTDELAAYKLAGLPFPGLFGVFYESDRPTKNTLEKKWIESSRAKVEEASDLDLLQKTFDRMK